MKITKRQLRRIIKEEKARLNEGTEPHAWAKAMYGTPDRDEENQTIIYLSKDDHPTPESFVKDLPQEWDWDETYDQRQWIVYTNQYPAGRADIIQHGDPRVSSEEFWSGHGRTESKKITKTQLQKIIKEEKARILSEYRENEYVIYPRWYVEQAMKILTPQEFLSVGIEKAMSFAEDAAEHLRDTWPADEGFGSSDHTYELQSYLENLGFKTGFPNGTLEVIRENRRRLSESRGGPMLDLGVALEDAIAKAQIAAGSANDDYQKKLANEVQFELEGLLEMLWDM